MITRSDLLARVRGLISTGRQTKTGALLTSIGLDDLSKVAGGDDYTDNPHFDYSDVRYPDIIEADDGIP